MHQALSTFVQTILPVARIEAQRLTPDTNSPAYALQLYLLNQNFPQHDLSQEQMLQLMDEPFYWAFCWASGLVLAEYIFENPECVRGKRVVDFGCGSGVVAIAAAMAGAGEVVACDIDKMALQATAANAELNGVELLLSDDFTAIEGAVDLLIVADVLYDRANLPWLTRFLEQADGVLLADSRVKNFDYPPYQLIDNRQGNTVPDLDESAEFRNVRIYSGNRLAS